MLKAIVQYGRALHQLFRVDEGIDLTEYIDHLCQHFGTAIGPDETPALNTLGDMSDLIGAKLASAGRPVPAETVWAGVRRITSFEMGVMESKLHPHTRYVEDLCC